MSFDCTNTDPAPVTPGLNTLLLSASDHWTTYLCLRRPVPGFDVTEANPLAAWLFAEVGLVEGLLIDSLLTLGALAFLLRTTRLPHVVKVAFLCVVVAGTGYAVVNNVGIIHRIGLSLL